MAAPVHLRADRLRQRVARHWPPRSICLIKPSALGDVVQTLPVVESLARHFPTAQITWVIREELADLVRGHAAVTEVLTTQRRPAPSAWWSLLRTLRSRRFDWCLDLQGLLRSAVMTMATGAPVKIGYETSREGSHLAVHGLVPGTDRPTPPAVRNRHLLEWLGLPGTLQSSGVALSSADHEFAMVHLANLPRPLFAIQCGAQWETKRWPVEKFARLAVRAIETWGGGIVLLGSPGERPLVAELERSLREASPGGSLMNLAGRTTLKQLAAVLEHCDFVISNDSGPLHLADAHGVPSLGLFTCTDSIRSGPASPVHELVSTSVACAASYRKKCPHSGDEHLACLSELDVARAWSGLERLVNRHGVSPVANGRLQSRRRSA